MPEPNAAATILVVDDDAALESGRVRMDVDRHLD